jgi:hypothetical protein
MTSPFAGKRRTHEEIMADVAAGHLDIAGLGVAYEVVVDKVDKSGEEPRLVETRKVLWQDGKVLEHTIIKH